jgi:hypothetical protein
MQAHAPASGAQAEAPILRILANFSADHATPLSCKPVPCLQGDNDPVDVVEIGSQTCAMGGVYPVKALGECCEAASRGCAVWDC